MLFYTSQGKDVTLKEVDTDVETYEPTRPRPRFRRFQRFHSNRRRRTVSEGGGGGTGAGTGTESQTENNGDVDRRPSRRYTRTRRFFRTRRAPQSETRANNENGNTVSK